MSKKWQILIVDDHEEGRNQAQAALLPVEGNRYYQQERLQLADELFDIIRCTIAGEAIKAIEKDELRPDLAIVDIDFQGLDSEYVERQGLIYKEEATSLRGFDVLESIHHFSPYTTVVLFTGKADQDDMIADELRRRNLRQGRGYFIKTSRAIGINELSAHLAECVQQLAIHLSELATQAQRRQIRELLTLPNAYILEQELEVANRTIVLKSMMAYTAIYNHSNNNILFDNITEKLLELFLLQRVEDFAPNGIWQSDCIHQAILDWRASNNYSKQNIEIDQSAANYVLSTIMNGSPIDILNRTNLTAHVRNNARYGHNSIFDATFYNALIVRRALLGLSHLAQKPVWGQGNNKKMDRVLDYFMETNGLGSNPDNMRNFFSQVRGLSIETLNIPQSLNTCFPHIMEEESLWLEQYPAQIISKINNRELTI